MSSRLDELDGYYKEIMLGEVIEDGQKEVPFQQAIVSCTPGLVAGELKFSVSCIFKNDLIMKTTMFLEENISDSTCGRPGGTHE